MTSGVPNRIPAGPRNQTASTRRTAMHQETKAKVHIQDRSLPLPIQDATVVREITAGVSAYKENGVDSRFTVRRPTPDGRTVRTVFRASQVVRVDEAVAA